MLPVWSNTQSIIHHVESKTPVLAFSLEWDVLTASWALGSIMRQSTRETQVRKPAAQRTLSSCYIYTVGFLHENGDIKMAIREWRISISTAECAAYIHHVRWVLLCSFISPNYTACSLPVKGAEAPAVANHKPALAVSTQTLQLSCSCVKDLLLQRGSLI